MFRGGDASLEDPINSLGASFEGGIEVSDGGSCLGVPMVGLPAWRLLEAHKFSSTKIPGSENVSTHGCIQG